MMEARYRRLFEAWSAGPGLGSEDAHLVKPATPDQIDALLNGRGPPDTQSR
jgi:hypothetical protein